MTKGMTLTAALTLACALAALPAQAQRGPQRGGHGPQGGPGSGPPPQSRFSSPPAYGAPSAHPGVSRSVGGGQQNVTVPTRFGARPDPSRSYGGPSGAPPMSSRRPSPSPGVRDRGPAPSGDPSRVQQALRSRDYDAIRSESQGVRSRAEDLQRMRPELSVQDRLKLPLLNHMYNQGADMMDQGRTERDDSKIRYGMQRVQEADQRLNRDDYRGGNDRNGRSPNGRGNRGSRD